jgi:hypothetical protein
MQQPSDVATPPTLPPAPRRRSPIAVAAAVVLALVAGVVAYALSRPERAPATSRSPEPTAPPEPSPEPTIATPTGLVADASAFKVTLTWGAVPDATGYAIARDGIAIGSSSSAGFVDETALPDQRYEYGVVAEGDEATSDPALLEVETQRASPGLARLEGLFNVKLKERSHYGLTLGKGGQRYTAAWRFVPRCEQGACAARWTDRSTRGLAADLKRGGPRYRGTVFGRFGGTCGGTRTTATVTVDLRVVDARAVDDAWRAARLVGTLSSRSASQLGCVSAGVVYGFTATLV